MVKEVYLKAAIVDDSETDRAHLRSLLETYGNGIHIAVEEFHSGNSFLDKVKLGFDLVFFDIDMPEMDGITLANRLRAIDKDILIVFVTNLGSYALQGYAVNAFDFLVKSIAKEDVQRTIERAIERKREPDQRKILLKIHGGYQALLVSEIIYVEIRGHDLTFHATSGEFSSKGGLREVEEELSASRFARCNNCFLVNLDFVQAIEKDEVVLPNGRLPISRNKKKEFVTRFLEGIQ